MSAIDTCADCGKKASHGVVLWIIVAREPFALCNGCYGVSLANAEASKREREQLKERMARREVKRHERTGSHG